MLIFLIGPKGSGKSHIGRLLEARLGVHFFHVEPLWKAYYADCKAQGREPTIAEGIERIRPAIFSSLEGHPHICIETTGASREILEDLLRLCERADTLLVRVNAPLPLCLERIASRDQTHQIPMDAASIRRVYELGSELDLPFDLMLENIALTPEEVLEPFMAFLNGEESRLRQSRVLH